jgi:ATP-dependent RNA helicase DDX23/PRP28
MNDRKFVFDWDEQEDTFSFESPSAVGASRQGAMVMFGRGHLAGMGEDGGGTGKRSSSGAGATNGGSVGPKSTVDERHWTEKPLGDMKDRDWRIFREDFSISTKGRHPFPTSLFRFS